MRPITGLILAAGRGTRMKSATPKVLHQILGRPIIGYVVDALKNAGIDEIVTVAGYGADRLKKHVAGTKIVLQKELLGSGDAVNAARRLLGRQRGDLLVICGDTPLLRAATVKEIVKKHRASGAAATVLTAKLADPSRYGRIVRETGGDIIKIVEALDASDLEAEIDEVNVGTYCFDARKLFRALSRVQRANRKAEYYLTDVIGILRGEREKIASVTVDDAREMTGINTRRELAAASAEMRDRILGELMDSGVTIEDPATTTVYPGVKIGADTVLHPNTLIESDIEIGRLCSVGPFARLRGGVRLGDRVEIGNFVELVRTSVGADTKIKHHTYLGDAAVGKRVNVGAGTITANYDGKRKNRTVIGDGAFIGIGSRLVAPVRIGSGAVLGAGCVILKGHNVPNGATAVGVPARLVTGTASSKKRGMRR